MWWSNTAAWIVKPLTNFMSCALSAVISETFTNERKHPGPLVVEGKLSDAERLKSRATTCAAPF